jgi:hypothetical protein
MIIKHISDYKRLRANEYPSQLELADALYWKERGDDSKWQAYIQRCDDVKAKYPKQLITTDASQTI